jgi:hypothetical protein
MKSLAVAIVLAWTSSAFAEKVDWSDYIEKRPAQTAKQPAKASKPVARPVTKAKAPAKTVAKAKAKPAPKRK